MLLKKIICYLIGIVLVNAVTAQADTAFWFAAPPVTSQHENTPEVLHLSTYANAATVTISEPANPSFQTQTVTIPAYTATIVTLSNQLQYVENKPASTVLNYGIKISSTSIISAYYEEGISKNPEIFPLKGALSLGLKFMIPSQTTLPNSSNFSLAKNGFVVVATQNNTTIKINLPIADSSGNTSYTITLNKGQTYSVRAAGQSLSYHLGGSIIQSDQPIAVTIYDDSIQAYSTNGCATCMCMDLIGDQIIPIINNGSEFIVVRGALQINSITQDYYYVWATSDNTTVSVNGTVVKTLNAGEHYDGTIAASSAYIVTSNPVYLYQMTGVSCEVGATNLPSIKCTGSQLVSFTRSTAETFQLNLLSKKADIGNFIANGTNIPASLFEAVPGTNDVWYAARITSSNYPNINTVFPAGSASIVSNTSGLFHLGFMNGTQGTGVRLGYFSNYATVQTSPQIASTTCLGSDIQLKSTYISGASYLWSGPNGFTSTSNDTTIYHASVINSGTYFLTANINGCGTSVDSVIVNVHPLPAITFIKSLDTVCYNSARKINYALTGTAPWNVTYSDGISSTVIPSVINSTSFFTVAPLKNTIYTITNIVDSNTCVMSNIITPANRDTLMVDTLPIPDFKLSNIRCTGKTVYFFDSSKTYLDTLTHWYWNFDNGSIVQQTKKDSLPEIFSSWGNHTVKMVVQSALGCNSDTLTKQILIHPLPQPGFILPEVCLNDSYAQFIDTSKIADNNFSGFTYHWKFGDIHSTPSNPDTSIIASPKHRYSTVGKYNVQLITTSGNFCVDSLTQIATVNGDKPKAVFALNNLNTKCSNDSVAITNFSSVNFGNVTWLNIYWDSSNNSVQHDSIAIPAQLGGDVYKHLYQNFQTTSQTKNFKIHFAAYSGATCVDTKDTIITIAASPVVGFSKEPGICYEANIRQLTQARETNQITGGFSYFGNGVSVSGLLNPAIAGVGADTVKALFISNAGCRDSAKQIITVWPSPTAKWNFSIPQCEKRNIIFLDSSLANANKIVTWKWDFGDGQKMQRNDSLPFKKSYDTSFTYHPYLIVTTDSGCVSKADTLSIEVHPLPHVNFGVPSVVCLPNGNAQFSDSTIISDHSTAFTYKWNFGDPADPSTALIPKPIHHYSSVGTYPVTLVVTSKDVCVDSITKLFSNIYPQPKANFTISSKEVCMGDTISFLDSTFGFTDSVVAWNWDLAQGNTATQKSATRVFADSGSFNISLYAYDAKGCISDTIMKTVLIDPIPHLSLTHQMFVLEGATAQIKPMYYALSPVTFAWSPPAYLDSTTVPYPLTTPKADITYSLKLTGKGNCFTTDTVNITVLKTPEIPNAFSPNGDGINDKWEIKYLQYYPGNDVKIFDRNGRIIFSSSGYSTAWDGTVNGKPVPIGTYYYIVNPKNGRSIMSGAITVIR
jgi:gliding motility-associated-like protein